MCAAAHLRQRHIPIFCQARLIAELFVERRPEFALKVLSGQTVELISRLQTQLVTNVLEPAQAAGYVEHLLLHVVLEDLEAAGVSGFGELLLGVGVRVQALGLVGEVDDRQPGQQIA